MWLNFITVHTVGMHVMTGLLEFQRRPRKQSLGPVDNTIVTLFREPILLKYPTKLF